MAAHAPAGGAPLEGLRVLAVEQYGAGPWGSLYLADLGAEVIKIENPKDGGDVSRGVGPHFFAPGDSQFFHTFNRNKKSIALDLKHPEGAAVLRDLAAGADALLDNLRGDVPQKIGLTYAQLAAANPRIVCAHLSAYGREGSRAGWPGYDFLMQAEAGYLTLTGEPGTPPAKFGLSMVDLTAGLACALGLLAAVMKARATGRGCDLDTSLYDVALHHLNYPATWYLNAGAVTGRQPRSAHPSIVPSQLYTTKDGWIFVMCNKEKFWRVLAAALGHPEWCDDPRLADFAARLRNRALVQELLDAAFAAQTTAAWLERLSGRVPVAPVRDVGEALDDAFVHERADVADFVRDDGPPVRMVVNPLRTPGVALPMRAAPALGAHTDELLAGLGYDAARIADLRACGAIG
ncbi:MAG: CoA transferase [Burkholderiales bacterium]|nr:CoA transferase [Burkholderiales bacterium]